jgi:hypothetical protein
MENDNKKSNKRNKKSNKNSNIHKFIKKFKYLADEELKENSPDEIYYDGFFRIIYIYNDGREILHENFKHTNKLRFILSDLLWIIKKENKVDEIINLSFN